MATMRKLKLQVQMTVDGFVAGPEGQRRVWWSDIRERIDRARSDRRAQHLRDPGGDRARNADLQGPQGAAADRFDRLSQRHRGEYVPAGEISLQAGRRSGSA